MEGKTKSKLEESQSFPTALIKKIPFLFDKEMIV
jgi:hypothetical protein